MNKVKGKTRIKLDPIGQFYASIINDDYPGNYSLSAYLKENIDPQALQLAVDKVMKRFPFLSGCLKKGFFHYYHELLPHPPKIQADRKGPPFTAYYHEGEGHVLRVLYGETHFRLETIHSICDGRGLTKVLKLILSQYFEYLGKEGCVEGIESIQEEACENAYKRLGNSMKIKEYPKISAYHHEGSCPSPVRIKTQTFDLIALKKRAKATGTNINGYLLAQLMQVIAEERKTKGNLKPITALMPIDCRSLFPSATFRNFVINSTIVMPETTNFNELTEGIQQQLQQIDKDFVQNGINTFQKMAKMTYPLPLVFKKAAFQKMENEISKQLTTTLSNLGLIKLPEAIEKHMDRLEFIISQEPHRPYTFACISLGNKLTLTVTASVKGDEIIEKLFARLEGK